MKLCAHGWSRYVYERTVWDIDLAESAVGQGFAWHGVNKHHVMEAEDATPMSGPAPVLRYKFKVDIGDSTMSGDYAATLIVTKSDVLSMFVDMFGDKSVLELSALLAEAQGFKKPKPPGRSKKLK